MMLRASNAGSTSSDDNKTDALERRSGIMNFHSESKITGDIETGGIGADRTLYNLASQYAFVIAF